ncbi:MAG: NlpC/P60 family protein [Verrucomicrobiota bacterium]
MAIKRNYVLGVMMIGAIGQTTIPEIPAPSTVVEMHSSQLVNFESSSPGVQKVLLSALSLTGMNLKYKYGSADPSSGGLDCSGTIYYILRKLGIQEVPRQASDIYMWVRKNDHFKAVWSTDPKTPELSDLRPGDLLFWVGTYDVNRDPPITHVMIYAGIEKTTGKRVMIGSSEGRLYDGKSRYGTSVFDFSLPGYPLPKWAAITKSRFIGYGKIPGIDSLNPPPVPLTPDNDPEMVPEKKISLE